MVCRIDQVPESVVIKLILILDFQGYLLLFSAPFVAIYGCSAAVCT